MQEASNPVLRKEDVDDVSDVLFVADPFILIEDGTWHMFMEVRKGPNSGDYAVTGHATSPNGYDWTYDQIVLDNGYQNSYQHIFKSGEDYYLVLGNSQGDLPLWKADNFPTSWVRVNTIADASTAAASAFKDPNVFRWDGRWWALSGGGTDGNLNAYYSDTLEADNWTEHDNNPVKTNADNAWRPGGRTVWWEDNGTDRLFIPFQHLDPNYGNDVNYYEITDLTPTSYSDTEVDAQMFDDQKTDAWNSNRMHHIDPWWRDGEGRWVACVDGNDGDEWTIGMFQVSTIYNQSVTEV